MSAAAVLAHDPASGPGAEPLERLLLARALAWARGVAGDHMLTACAAEDAPGLERAVGDAARILVTAPGPFPARVEAILAELGVEPGGPCLLMWPRLGRPDVHLAAVALEDLRSGCELVIGPVFDGGLYLLGLNGRVELIAAVSEATWSANDVIGAAVSAAYAAKVDVGLLRTERGLRRPSDRRAALADPLLDEDLRAVLAT
jgi:hypothetical protein